MEPDSSGSVIMAPNPHVIYSEDGESHYHTSDLAMPLFAPAAAGGRNEDDRSKQTPSYPNPASDSFKPIPRKEKQAHQDVTAGVAFGSPHDLRWG